MDSKLWYEGPRWKFWCRTAWEQLLQNASDPENQNLQDGFRYYMNFFGNRPVCDWPVFGCGARFRPWTKDEPDVDICSLRFIDEHGKNVYERHFLAQRPPTLIDEVIEKHQDSLFKAVEGMSPEELQSLFPRYTYRNLAWAPEGYAGLKGVGYFPFEDISINKANQVMAIDGWGNLFLAIAWKNLDGLAPVWAMGYDMCERPLAYENSVHKKPPLPKAEDFNLSVVDIRLRMTGWEGPLARDARERSRSPRRHSG